MTRMPIKRLTPIVPGEMQPFVFIDGSIKTGFISSGRTEGRGFPQWAMPGPRFRSRKAHFFDEPNSGGIIESLCGYVSEFAADTFMPGNFPRCEICRRRWQKMMLKRGVK